MGALNAFRQRIRDFRIGLLQIRKKSKTGSGEYRIVNNTFALGDSTSVHSILDAHTVPESPFITSSSVDTAQDPEKASLLQSSYEGNTTRQEAEINKVHASSEAAVSVIISKEHKELKDLFKNFISILSDTEREEIKKEIKSSALDLMKEDPNLPKKILAELAVELGKEKQGSVGCVAAENGFYRISEITALLNECSNEYRPQLKVFKLPFTTSSSVDTAQDPEKASLLQSSYEGNTTRQEAEINKVHASSEAAVSVIISKEHKELKDLFKNFISILSDTEREEIKKEIKSSALDLMKEDPNLPKKILAELAVELGKEKQGSVGCVAAENGFYRISEITALLNECSKVQLKDRHGLSVATILKECKQYTSEHAEKHEQRQKQLKDETRQEMSAVPVYLILDKEISTMPTITEEDLPESTIKNDLRVASALSSCREESLCSRSEGVA